MRKSNDSLQACARQGQGQVQLDLGLGPETVQGLDRVDGQSPRPGRGLARDPDQGPDHKR